MFHVVLRLFYLSCSVAAAMEPLAPLAQQPLWQAAEPMQVNIDFDVPAFGLTEEIRRLRDASSIEHQIEQGQELLGSSFTGKEKSQKQVNKQASNAILKFSPPR